MGRRTKSLRSPRLDDRHGPSPILYDTVSVLSKKILHCADFRFSEHAITQPCRPGVTNMVPPGTRSPARTTLVARWPVLKIESR